MAQFAVKAGPMVEAVHAETSFSTAASPLNLI
jgi:hypothetical protein